jgi:hypothetical protein
MATAIQDRRDLSHIKNLDDLRKEIQVVKARINTKEQYFKEIKKDLPREALQTVLGKAVPLFLTRGVAVRTFGLLKNAVGLFSSVKRSGRGNIKEGLLSSVKKVGVITALKAAFNLYKNRKR